MTGSANADSFRLEWLHVFRHAPNGQDGADPGRILQVTADGTVFGTTRRGGTYGGGTVYTISRDGTFKILHEFSGREGLYPAACLVPGRDGGYYGATTGSLSIVFKITADGSFSNVYTFQTDQNAPAQRVSIKARDGNVYTTTGGEGFRLLLAGAAAAAAPDLAKGPSDEHERDWTSLRASALAPTASGSNGRKPGMVSACQDAVVAPDGDIYDSGSNGNSMLERSIDRGSARVMTDVFDLLKPTDDQRKAAGVTGAIAVGRNGDVYGISHWGQSNPSQSGAFRTSPKGIVAWIAPAPEDLSMYPSPGLMLAGDGYLYTTAVGSTHGEKVLLKISADGKITRAMLFPPQTRRQDRNDVGPLVEGPDGSLYGTAGYAGAGTDGAVFRITRSW